MCCNAPFERLVRRVYLVYFYRNSVKTNMLAVFRAATFLLCRVWGSAIEVLHWSLLYICTRVFLLEMCHFKVELCSVFLMFFLKATVHHRMREIDFLIAFSGFWNSLNLSVFAIKQRKKCSCSVRILCIVNVCLIVLVFLPEFFY